MPHSESTLCTAVLDKAVSSYQTFLCLLEMEIKMGFNIIGSNDLILSA